MNFCRGLYAAGLLAFVLVPILIPFGEMFQRETWAWTADDRDRLIHLSQNTLALTAGTVALAMPWGVGLGVLLFRTSFVARRFLIGIVLFVLFVPLPLIVSSWQGLLGTDGWLPLGFWRGSAVRPWATGMGPAIWIHALAALPWVTLIVGVGLTWVEPEREEEAAQVVGPWRVLILVTLPRARASILAAALFVVLQTAGEVSVTDIMQVTTLAEEVRLQFAVADRAGLARTLVLSMPSLVLAWVGVFVVLSYLERALPPLAAPTRSGRALTLGPAWLRVAAAMVSIGLLVLPAGSLLWKLGLTGHPRSWSGDVAWHFLQLETHVLRKNFPASFGTAVAAGMLTAGIALGGCWLARERRWFRWLLFGVLTLAWVLPGTIVGVGLHDTILLLPAGPWKTLLWYARSPLPLIWVQTIRTLPIAVVFLWPVVRMIPRELFEEARLCGAGPWSEWFNVVIPMTRRALGVTALAASALCLGEVAASLRVETPGWPTFMSILLEHMHYNFANNLAALCLLMLGSLVVMSIVAAFGVAIARRREGRRVKGCQAQPP